MSRARLWTLLASVVVTGLYLLGRLGGRRQDLINEDFTRVLALGVVVGWIMFVVLTVEERFGRRLEDLHQQILVYGDQRATDAHLEARRREMPAANGNGYRADAASILRQVGK
jgi:hypothetical protein